jgi:ATP-dependent Lon protease
LRGKVLPIGGVKEKLLAAHRAGITTIVLPKENGKDLVELPEDVKEALSIHQVDFIDEAWRIALEEPAAKSEVPTAEVPIWGQPPSEAPAANQVIE